ncbi:unnamed protein product [Callosobruchus maculatus]|uniref:Uncharacterized protein n=1 Tax=Callosobruchus maculatus TaxID=64391 RepID=A0A653CJY4_CALMS|nr:unnamed protein product [Callosobruchus maculatus]
MTNDDTVTDDNDPETQIQENENEDGEIILEIEPGIESYNDALDVISKLKRFARAGQFYEQYKYGWTIGKQLQMTC